MDRRVFLGASAGLAALPLAALAATPAEEAEVKQRLVDWYRAFAGTDRAHYRTFMTDDYLLLENGELLDLAGDQAMMATLPADYQRTDTFDFRYVRIDRDHAYLAYFLRSEMNDSQQGQRSRQWLESAVFRRTFGEWRCALLHSTRINPPTAA